MDTVGLFYVGAVLFINGLMLLERVDAKSAAIFNLFVGALQTITPLYLIMTAGENPWLIFSASGILLFGFTYLYVGIVTLLNIDTNGIGWYSLWVAIAACSHAGVNMIYLKNIKFGIIWLMWAFLWLLFFLLLGLKKDIRRFTGWVTLIISWFTATIPAFLILINAWDIVSNALFAVFALLLVIWFVYLYFKRGTDSKKPSMRYNAPTG